jgi:hypothetical protein
MKKLHIKISIATCSLLAVSALSCTKLNEKLYGAKTPYDASKPASSADLNGVYAQLNGQVTNQILMLYKSIQQMK